MRWGVDGADRRGPDDRRDPRPQTHRGGRARDLRCHRDPSVRPDPGRGDRRAVVADRGDRTVAYYRNAGVDRCDGAGADRPVIYGTTKIAENNELSGFESRDDTATVAGAGQAVFNGTAPEHRYPLWWLVPRRCSD